MAEPAASKIVPADRIRKKGVQTLSPMSPVPGGQEVINIGPGIPDNLPMPELMSGLQEFLLEKNGHAHQYQRPYGTLPLVNAISKLYSSLHGRDIDPISEIVVTTGAIAALHCSFHSFINAGDEVIIIEPYFPPYISEILRAGGKPVLVSMKLTKLEGQLSSSDWKLDISELEGKFNAKTKAILINTPNNPTGKVFTKQELSPIADLCIQYNVLCISDEVYEFAVYHGAKHFRIATLPDMWERTITISSAGKIFDATGWRIGWIISSKSLVESLMATASLSLSTSLLPQHGIAHALKSERLGEYFQEKIQNLQKKRDFVVAEMRKAGLNPISPEAGLLLIADWTGLGLSTEIEDGSTDFEDTKFVKWLIRERQLSVWPVSQFFADGGKGLAKSYIRICFAKQDGILESAMEKLHKPQ